MPTITIPKVRKESDVMMYVTLTDSGVTVDWTSLSDVLAFMYSNEQECIAGQCEVAIASGDPTTLNVRYTTMAPQFLGVNSLLIRCTYDGMQKSFDVPVLDFVDRSAEATGVVTLDDPELPVAIEVTDVDTSLLDAAIAAALDAAAAAAAAAALVPLDVLTQCQEATVACQDATVHASPIIGENGNWKYYDAETGEYVDSEKPSRGIQGPQGEQGPQGIQGNTGSSVDYPYELVNNLTTDDATKGLSAAQGKALADDLGQLDQKYDETVPGSTNIMDIFHNVSWYTTISSTGVVKTDTTDHVTDYLPIKPSTKYTASHNGYITWWTSEKAFISRSALTSSTKTVTSPATAAYMRVEIIRTNWAVAHVNEGETLLDNVQYRAPYTFDKVARNYGDVTDLNGVVFTDGKVPVGNFTQGAIIRFPSYVGDIFVTTPEESTGFECAIIPVLEGERFSITGTGGSAGRVYSWADGDYRALYARGINVHVEDEIVTAPADGYLIVNFTTQSNGSVYKLIKASAIPSTVKSQFDRSPYAGKGNRYGFRYRGLQSEYAAAADLGHSTKYATFISLMDALVTEADGYITKTAIGTAEGTDEGGNEYTIYDYAFIPSAVSSFEKGKRPVVLIDCCIHGFEKNSFFGWYYFLKDLVENYDQNDALLALRSMVEIHFVPAVNPWGVDRDERNNANGINLNRNFDVPNWVEVASGANASGAEPFDQAETAAVRDWIIAHKNHLLAYINTHTNGHYNADGWVEANALSICQDTADNYYNRIFDVAKEHIEMQTAAFMVDYDFEIPVSSRFGQVMEYSEETTSGFADAYATIMQKVVGITLEGFNGLVVSDVTVAAAMSPTSKKINSEIFGNMLLEILEEYIPQ